MVDRSTCPRPNEAACDAAGFGASNPVLVVKHLVSQDRPAGRHCWIWCPGCEELHAPRIVGEAGDLPEGPCWDWDGDLEQPTFSPSLLVTGVQWAEDEPFHKPQHTVPAGSSIACHSFIRGGRWEFLADSTHRLAGLTVPMVPVPDWVVGR